MFVRILESRVFGAAGVRETGTGVRIVQRRMHVRLGAGRRRPPARGMLLGFAHLYAAVFLVGACALTIASCRGNRSKKCGGIGEKSD